MIRNTHFQLTLYNKSNKPKALSGNESDPLGCCLSQLILLRPSQKQLLFFRQYTPFNRSDNVMLYSCFGKISVKRLIQFAHSSLYGLLWNSTFIMHILTLNFSRICLFTFDYMLALYVNWDMADIASCITLYKKYNCYLIDYMYAELSKYNSFKGCS